MNPADIESKQRIFTDALGRKFPATEDGRKADGKRLRPANLIDAKTWAQLSDASKESWLKIRDQDEKER